MNVDELLCTTRKVLFVIAMFAKQCATATLFPKKASELRVSLRGIRARVATKSDRRWKCIFNGTCITDQPVKFSPCQVYVSVTFSFSAQRTPFILPRDL